MTAVLDVLRCDGCGVASCTVATVDCPYEPGQPDLCDDCAPSHAGCDWCDPDRGER